MNSEIIYPLTKVFEVEYSVPRSENPEIFSHYSGARDIRMRLHAQISAKIGISFAEYRDIPYENFISYTQNLETRFKEDALNAFENIVFSSMREFKKDFLTNKKRQRDCFDRTAKLKLYEFAVDDAFEVPVSKFVGLDALAVLSLDPSSCIVPPETISITLEVGPRKPLTANFVNQNNFNVPNNQFFQQNRGNMPGNANIYGNFGKYDDGKSM